MYLPENVKAIHGLQVFHTIFIRSVCLCPPGIILREKAVHAMLDTASMVGGPDWRPRLPSLTGTHLQ